MELADTHPDFVSSNVLEMIREIMEAENEEALKHVLNRYSSSGDTEQVSFSSNFLFTIHSKSMYSTIIPAAA